jgi:hypothetical protein
MRFYNFPTAIARINRNLDIMDSLEISQREHHTQIVLSDCMWEKELLWIEAFNQLCYFRLLRREVFNLYNQFILYKPGK